MEELEDMEEDAGLGNGGLGRLAGLSVFLISLYLNLSTILINIFRDKLNPFVCKLI